MGSSHCWHQSDCACPRLLVLLAHAKPHPSSPHHPEQLDPPTCMAGRYSGPSSAPLATVCAAAAAVGAAAAAAARGAVEPPMGRSHCVWPAQQSKHVGEGKGRTGNARGAARTAGADELRLHRSLALRRHATHPWAHPPVALL